MSFEERLSHLEQHMKRESNYFLTLDESRKLSTETLLAQQAWNAKPTWAKWFLNTVYYACLMTVLIVHGIAGVPKWLSTKLRLRKESKVIRSKVIITKGNLAAR